MMRHIIQACEENEANRAGDGEDGRENRQRFLEPGSVRGQCSSVPQPAFRDEDEVEGNNGDGTHRNEQRLQIMRPDI
jgi:hypothetical protein